MGGDENKDGDNGLVGHSSTDSCSVQLDCHPESKGLVTGKWSNDFHVRIDFKGLKYSVPAPQRGKERKEILCGVSGFFHEKCLNAIIGPSGAGKSTLLSAICGLKTSNVQGTIEINGVTSGSNLLRKVACYIPQDIALLPWLTTKETLYFAARLKIVKGCDSTDSYGSIVSQTAAKLGLLDCLGTMADNLSGGEKKRLSIGVEIIVNPKVLVLDEPTSGLDSAASSLVLRLLKNLADSGCTVACAIHQPSSQMMTIIDNVLVLTGGREIYCGPRTNIIETFERAGFVCPSFYNIGEFVIEVATGQRTGDIDLLKELNSQLHFSSVKNTDEAKCAIDQNQVQSLLDLNNFEGQSVGWAIEFKMLLWRAVTCIRRDSTMTKLRLAAHIVVALLLGIVFRRFGDDGSKTLSNIACLFFFLLFLFFANAMPAVQMFPIEAAVFAREYLNNWYSLWTYYVAKVLTDLPLQIICPTFFLLIGYSLTGQPLDAERFIKAWLICFFLSILAQSFGILTGATFNTHVGCFLVPALNIPMFLFAGFFLKLNETPTYLYPLRDISFFRYAFEGILQAVYNDRESLKCTTEFCILRSPKLILAHMDMPSTSFTNIILALLSWIASLHILIFAVLRWKLVKVVK